MPAATRRRAERGRALGLNPNRPQQAAGMRVEPPVSVPSPISARPAATAAAEPPDEPPTIRSGQTGFFTSGVTTPKPAASHARHPDEARAGAPKRFRYRAASLSARRSANSGSPAVKGCALHRDIVLHRQPQIRERTERSRGAFDARHKRMEGVHLRAVDRLTYGRGNDASPVLVAEAVHQRLVMLVASRKVTTLMPMPSHMNLRFAQVL